MIVKQVIGTIRDKFFPSEHRSNVKKWWADGGIMSCDSTTT